MPAVKKIKPINFIVKRGLVVSALALYGFEILLSKIEGDPRLPLSFKDEERNKFLDHKTQFYQKFKVDYINVINNSVVLLIDGIIQIDTSQKDVSELIAIFDDYINLLQKSEKQPVKLIYASPETIAIGAALGVDVKNKNVSQWYYKGFSYEVQGHYSEEEIRLLILEDFDKERRMFEKLRAKFDDVTADALNYERSRIPEKVRIEVWRRDSGKCARCGSREKLEYDHIVPISKGGSNTVRNIELLCEKCNRSKSNNVV